MAAETETIYWTPATLAMIPQAMTSTWLPDQPATGLIQLNASRTSEQQNEIRSLTSESLREH